MSKRFPGIDWWCDRCGSSLNEQEGFDDHKYIWKCKICGYKNSISADNIRVDFWSEKLKSGEAIILDREYE